MDKSREQFEYWYWNEFGQFEEDGWPECFAFEEGEYRRLGTRMSWAAWQASRAAVEVELDDKVMVEDEFDKGHNCAIDYCAESIRAAGLKVKGE
ncbi:hypothetical protein ACI00F_003793 [Cronobacter dublinensis]